MTLWAFLAASYMDPGYVPYENTHYDASNLPEREKILFTLLDRVGLLGDDSINESRRDSDERDTSLPWTGMGDTTDRHGTPMITSG